MATGKKCWECGYELIEFFADYYDCDEEGETISTGEDEIFYACNHCYSLYSKDDRLLYQYLIDTEDATYDQDEIKEIMDSNTGDFFPIEGRIMTGEYVERSLYDERIRAEIEENREKRAELKLKKASEQEKDKIAFTKEQRCWECGGSLTEIQRYYSESIVKYDNDGRKNYEMIDGENKKSFFVCKHCRFIYSEDGQLIHYRGITRSPGSPSFEDAEVRTTENNFIEKIQTLQISSMVSKKQYTDYFREVFFIEGRERARNSYSSSPTEEWDRLSNRSSSNYSDGLTIKSDVSSSQQQARCKYCGSTSLQAVKRGQM